MADELNFGPAARELANSDWAPGSDLTRPIRPMFAPDVPSTEKAVKGLEAEREIGVPAAAAAHLPDVNQILDERRAQRKLRETTALRKWMSDPMNIALARDDIDKLTAVEKLGNAMYRSTLRVGSGARVLMAERSQSLAKYAGKTPHEIRQMLLPPEAEAHLRASGEHHAIARYAAEAREIYDALKNESPEDLQRRAAEGYRAAGRLEMAARKLRGFDATERVRKRLEPALRSTSSSEQIALFFDAMLADPSDSLVFIAETLAESGPPLIAGTAATLATKNPWVGAAVMGGGSGAIEFSGKAQEFLQSKSVDITTDEGVEKLLSDPAIMREAVDKGIAKGIVVGMFDALSGGLAGKALAKSPVGDILIQAGVQAVLGGAGEAVGDFAAGDTPNMANVLLEALVEIAGVPVEVMGVGGRGILKNMDKAAHAGGTGALLKAIDVAVADSKLASRDTTKLREFIETTDLSQVTLTVPAVELQTLFQEGAYTPDDFEIDLTAYEDAVELGGDVDIKGEVYATIIANSDVAPWFHEHARIGDDEMSVAAAQRFNDRVREIIDEDRATRDAEIQAEMETRASEVQVKDEVYRQMRAAGMSPDEAETNARLLSANLRAQAEKAGEDVLDFYRMMPVRVQRERGPVQRIRADLDIAINALRRRKAPVKSKAETLMKWVIASGGLQDRGGDVAALQGPDTLIAQTDDQMRQPNMLGGERPGMSLDVAARRAVEAGFFPEMAGRINDPNAVEADMVPMLLDALRREMAGEVVVRPEDMPEMSDNLADLERAIEEAGLDVNAQSNDEIVEALGRAWRPDEGYTFNQAPPVNSAAFREWAGTDEIIEPDEIKNVNWSGPGPFVMRAWHGTTHNFEAFDASVTGNKEGQFGAVNYFTTDESDASGNYGGMGPDLTIRVEIMQERIERDIEDLWPTVRDGAEDAEDAFGDLLIELKETYDFDTGAVDNMFVDNDPDEGVDAVMLARHIAYTLLHGGDEKVLEVYVRTEKPFVVGGDQSPWAEFRGLDQIDAEAIKRVAEDADVTVEEVEAARDEYEDQIDDARWEIESETESELFLAVDRVATKYEVDAQELYAAVSEFDMEGGRHSDLEQALRDSEALMYAEDFETGAPVGFQMLGEIIEELGFDSIVMLNPAERFSNMNIDPGAAHIQVFDKHNTNIKSVENTGAFSRDDPRILYQPAWHGSPHIFDRFSTEHMGRGEGAQAFGWGLYFADRKGVAKHYRERLARAEHTAHATLDGQRITKRNLDKLVAPATFRGGDVAEHFVRRNIAALASGNQTKVAQEFDSVLARWQNEVKIFQERAREHRENPPLASTYSAADYDTRAEIAQHNVDNLKALWDRLEFVDKKAGGRLYKVEIPDNDELLVWDRDWHEGLSEEREKALFVAVDQQHARAEQTGMDTAEKWRNLLNALEDGITDSRTEKNRDITGEELSSQIGQILAPGTEEAPRAAAEWLRDVAGIPGHRFLDGVSRGDGEGSYNYVIYDDSRISVLDFEQRNAEGPRGSITFPGSDLGDGETVIRLFESKNLSTFLHEVGHLTLRQTRWLADRLPDNEQVQRDKQVIDKFLKHEGGGAYSVSQEEKWARAFEAYLMEGKSPSLDLMEVFARTKAWLTRIYRTVMGLDVTLNDDVREVMDRLVATDAEIAEARAAAGMKPLFNEATAAGMTDAQFNAYRRLAQRGKDEGEQRLLERTMAKVRRQKDKWYKDELEAVYKEVTDRANRLPQYRLTEALLWQRWFNDDGTVREIDNDMRLNREELIQRYTVGVLSELGRLRGPKNRGLYGGTSSVEEVADFFGFRSADDMIQILQNTPRRKDYIRAEVERVMVERHGDPLNDGSIEEEALAAIHSDQQAEVVAAEARHLAKRAGRDPSNLTSRVYRARAKAMIGRLEVRSAIKPARYLQAERQAARQAEAEFAKIASGATVLRTDQERALEAAYEAKERQMLNHYLYAEARDLEAYVKRSREQMRQYDRTKVREKIGAVHIEQIDALLQDYDFRVTSQRQVDRRNSLAAYVQQMIADGRESELEIDPRLVEEARKVHYTRMSVDEFRGLVDTIKNIDHMGRFKQSLIEKGRKRELRRSVDRVVATIRAAAGEGKSDQNRGPGAFVDAFFNTIKNIDTMAVGYDQGDEMGAFYEEIKQSIDDGSAEEQRMNVEMMKRMDDLWKVYSGDELREMQVKRVYDEGNGHAWSKLDVLAIALNSGNLDGIERLTNQDVYFERRLTNEQRQAMINTLSKKDMEFVQSMWDLVNSYWTQLAAGHERRTGIKPEKVEAAPVDTPHGVYRGGYFPIAYDPDLPGRAVLDEESAFEKAMTAGHGARAAVANGMTKRRQQTGGGRTLSFEPTVAIRHLRDTIRFIALSEAVDATSRIIEHPDVRDAFISAGRRSDWETLRLWRDDVARGPSFNTDPFNSVARVVKANFTMSKLAFNLKTVALQVTGLTQSAVVVGKRNMLKAMVDYIGGNVSPEEQVAAIVDASPFMAERMTTMQKDVYDIANDLTLTSPVAGQFSKARAALFKLGFEAIVRTQFHIVDVPTWIAGYRQGMERFGTEEQAIRYADRMVARSQASGMLADRAGMERGTLNKNTRQSDVIRLFTTLGGYMLNKWNRLRVEGIKIANAENPGEVLNASLNMVILLMAEGVVMGLAYSLMADDDDEKDNSFARFILAETGSALLGGIPILRDLPSGFKGFGAGSPLDEIVEAPTGLYNQIMQGEFDTALVRAALNTMGIATGLPTVQPMRALKGLLEDDVPVSEMFFGRNPMVAG